MYIKSYEIINEFIYEIFSNNSYNVYCARFFFDKYGYINECYSIEGNGNICFKTNIDKYNIINNSDTTNSFAMDIFTIFEYNKLYILQIEHSESGPRHKSNMVEFVGLAYRFFEYNNYDLYIALTEILKYKIVDNINNTNSPIILSNVNMYQVLLNIQNNDISNLEYYGEYLLFYKKTFEEQNYILLELINIYKLKIFLYIKQKIYLKYFKNILDKLNNDENLDDDTELNIINEKYNSSNEKIYKIIDTYIYDLYKLNISSRYLKLLHEKEKVETKINVNLNIYNEYVNGYSDIIIYLNKLYANLGITINSDFSFE